jgi:hypothetical protein
MLKRFILRAVVSDTPHLRKLRPEGPKSGRGSCPNDFTDTEAGTSRVTSGGRVSRSNSGRNTSPISAFRPRECIASNRVDERRSRLSRSRSEVALFPRIQSQRSA